MRLLSLILLALLPLASHALNYEQRVRHITGNDLIRHFDLTDRSGTAAVDRSPNGTSGTYTNSPTLSSIVGADGKRAPLFDGVDQYVVLGTLSPLGDSADFSFGVWIKVSGSGVWTDGVERTAMMIRNTGDNWAQIKRHSVDNVMRIECRSGGTVNNLDITSISTLDWFHIGCVVKNTGDMEVYLDGVSQGTITKSSTWTGSGGWLDGAIGRASDVNFRFWHGYLSNAVISDLDHSDADMLEIGTP